MSDNRDLRQSVRSRASSEDEMGKDAGGRVPGKKADLPEALDTPPRDRGLKVPAPIFLAGSKSRAEKLAAGREHQRLWRQRHPEEARAKVKAWTAANPEKKRKRDARFRAARQERKRPARLAARAARHEAALEKKRARGRSQYQARREVSLERSKAWREANPDRMRQLLRAWKVANPEKVRAAKRGRDRKSTARHRARLMKLQRGRCAYCRDRLDETCHIDHVIPRAAGGSNRRSNLQLTCAPCNLSKGARDPIAFAQTMGRLL